MSGRRSSVLSHVQHVGVPTLSAHGRDPVPGDPVPEDPVPEDPPGRHSTPRGAINLVLPWPENVNSDGGPRKLTTEAMRKIPQMGRPRRRNPFTGKFESVYEEVESTLRELPPIQNIT